MDKSKREKIKFFGSFFDFDQTFYERNPEEMADLEKRINLSSLKSIFDGLKNGSNLDTGLVDIEGFFENNSRIDDFEKIETYFKNSKNLEGEIFENFNYEEIKDSEHSEIAELLAEAYTKLEKPNHRCYGPRRKKGFNVDFRIIRENYKNYATIDYKRIKPNILIQERLRKLVGKMKGQNEDIKIFIYTDNSEWNVKAGLEALRNSCSDVKEKALYNEDNFIFLDMFMTEGHTKKTEKGLNRAMNIIETGIYTNDKEENVSVKGFFEGGLKVEGELEFFDDSRSVLEEMSGFLKNKVLLNFVTNKRIRKFKTKLELESEFSLSNVIFWIKSKFNELFKKTEESVLVPVFVPPVLESVIVVTNNTHQNDLINSRTAEVVLKGINV